MKFDRADWQSLMHALGDALDRIGVTIMALSVIGGWFSEAFTAPKALIGMSIGLFSLLLGFYAKLRIEKDRKEVRK